MFVQQRFNFGAQLFGGCVRRESQVEIGTETAGDHIDCAAVRPYRGDLQTRGREAGMRVPLHVCQRLQGLQGAWNRVVGEFRVGDVAGGAVYGQVAGERTAPADFDRVAEPLAAARLADQAVINLLAAFAEDFHHRAGAVQPGALFIAGD